MSERIQARTGRPYTDSKNRKFEIDFYETVPAHSFLLSRDGRVTACEDVSGKWVSRDEAVKLLMQADDEIKRLKDGIILAEEQIACGLVSEGHTRLLLLINEDRKK